MTKQTSDKFQLSIATINYGGELNNMFEFYSQDLDNEQIYIKAKDEFISITFDNLLSKLTNKYLIDNLNKISLTDNEKMQPIFDLVKNEH